MGKLVNLNLRSQYILKLILIELCFFRVFKNNFKIVLLLSGHVNNTGRKRTLIYKRQIMIDKTFKNSK